MAGRRPATTNFTLDQHRVNEGTLRLAAAGEVALASSKLLGDAISKALTSGNYAELIVDLDQVTFLDSTGIAVLVAGHHLAAESGLAYVVTNPNGMVRRTLSVTKVLDSLTHGR